MLAHENQKMTETGPGTPAGNWMRLYWQPVALTEELAGPRPVVTVRLLGEDLVLFRNEDGSDLARVIIDTLQDATAAQARVQAASQVVGRYDWSAVTDEVLDVYDMALSTAHTRVAPAPGSRTMLGRLRDALDD